MFLHVKPHKILSLYIVFVSLIFQFSVSVSAAPVFSDVDSSHWAFASISKIADIGLIVGDSAGKYNPDDFIDKFETAKILARVAGFKQIDYTESEKSFYDKAYEKNRIYLNQYSKTYKKWNTTADRQIAFLLEKEILTPDDLKDFVGIKTDGTEGVRALTKEDAAMFVTKTVGKKTEALTKALPVLYLDDTKVSAAARPYVYYLKSAGVMHGDESNSFNPKAAITKAGMADLLDKVFTYAGIDTKQFSEAEAEGETFQSVEGERVETVSGTFVNYYESADMNAVQLILGDGTKKIYKVSENITIFVNGFLKTAEDLQEGMKVSAVLESNIIVDIKADILSGANDTLAVASADTSTINGIVLSVSEDSVAKTIAAEIKFKGVDGAEITEVKSYLLSEKCVITRNGENAAFADIQKGDIISAEVSGTRMHSMSLTEKSRDISAVFVKAQKNTNGVVYLTFSQSGKEKSYVLENVAKVTRNGQEIAWQNLRIGDLLTLKCEYERISDVVATSVKSQTSGKVTQIRMDKSGSYVTISSESSETEYKIIPNRVDVRSFFIGSGVTLFLDSKEVELALIADDALGFPRFKGYIVSKRYSSILMTNLNAKTPENTEVSVNENTVYTDSVTGKEITYEQLPDKALIYVVLDESLKTALYVTVL